MEEGKGHLQDVLKFIEKKIVDLISEKSSSVVRQVSDIPRLYRRTNREIPTQPCSYVSSLLAPVYELEKVHGAYVTKWVPLMLSAVTLM